jgi:predicted enzyme related to lactoylglutathione lyase
MHKSRLAGLIIDCQTSDLSGAADFWGQALGYVRRQSNDPVDDNYIVLNTGVTDLHIELQQVDHPSRVHLDIETDDIEAEVSRLEQLGARRVKQVNTWWVMQAPSGHRFCVIPAEPAEFETLANHWD